MDRGNRSLLEEIEILRLAYQASVPSEDAPAWEEGGREDWLLHAPSSFAGQRALMVEAIRNRMSTLVGALSQQAIEHTLCAMNTVPREQFICPWVHALAYLPMSIDIGLDQTISHPELVAILAAAANPNKGWVLDVGTGSGYQAAILSHMAQRVTSIEVIEPHARKAQERFRHLGYENIECLVGDAGVPGRFPDETFDAIVVAAGSSVVPDAFWKALKVGGRLVMPVGSTKNEEKLVLHEKCSGKSYRSTELKSVEFVPLTGVAARQ